MFYKRILHKPLGKILIDKGIITPEQLKKVLDLKEKEGGFTGQLLVKMGFASEEDIMFALMAQYEIPYVPLDKYEINFDLFVNFPVFGMEKYQFIPLEIIESVVTISTADPFNSEIEVFIKEEAGLDAVSFIATPSEIARVLNLYKEEYGLA